MCFFQEDHYHFKKNISKESLFEFIEETLSNAPNTSDSDSEFALEDMEAMDHASCKKKYLTYEKILRMRDDVFTFFFNDNRFFFIKNLKWLLLIHVYYEALCDNQNVNCIKSKYSPSVNLQTYRNSF